MTRDQSKSQTDRLIGLKRPEITSNYQLEVVVSRNETLQDVINGMILAALLIGPISLVTPSVI